MTSNPHVNRNGRAAGPAPVTAWPPPFAGCTPAEAVTAAISRLTATYTRAGQVVIDLHPTPRRVAAVTQTRRRVIAVTGTASQASTLLERARAARHTGPKDAVRVWITDEPAVRLATGRSVAGLILADADDPDRLPAGVKSWAASARHALRPAGRLAVICADPDQARPASLLEVAGQIGLRYAQRIILRADHPAEPTDAPGNTHHTPPRANVDVYLFTAARGDCHGR